MNTFIIIEFYKTYKTLNITLKFKKPKLVKVLFLKSQAFEQILRQSVYKPQLWNLAGHDLRPVT